MAQPLSWDSRPLAGMPSDGADQLELKLRVADPEVIAELTHHAEGPDRDTYALGALRIGVLALRQAQGRIDSEVVRNEGERLLSELRNRLEGHAAQVQQGIQQNLKEYFDPSDGRFSERVERLVRQDGELEQVLRRQIGQGDSELVRTLAEHFGATSPLMKILSPDETQGILASLRTSLEKALDDQRGGILKQFSLDDEQSALSRLVRELTARHGQLSDTLKEHIDEMVSEFDLNDDDSALSRLVHRVDQAQKQISNEFSLDVDTSALARMRKELLEVLTSHKEAASKFQEEVRVTLATMQARREESQRSTRHGGVFEDEVFAFVQNEAQRAGDVAEHTGNTTGVIKNCKVGDAVVELGPESAARGARVAIEAKQEANYDLTKACVEIETARKNRDASVGLFVFSRRIAPAGLEPFARYGDDIVVVWDAEDPATDLYLRAGLSVARALATRAATMTESQTADLDTMERAIRAVEKQIAGFEELSRLSGNILRDGEKIEDRVRKMQREIQRQVEALDESMVDLKNSLGDESSATAIR